ncbi:acetyl-CoA synthetase-like protein [Aspergillus steynii IBT 23096]|uniref:Acetyl-CoA synthetase-like protein n=1 Tax=Aspergillus steynii IBT 23096 TaxID=1392250 RepID=A0A2I2G182_9EURO|nr:acetyl-CoA synthetase-like protein [Aspergillus steynii IBT 23096]PLB46629.1 acetyl-CoA synthetase-like protein [Aspergillus steynii IBT 23096]
MASMGDSVSDTTSSTMVAENGISTNSDRYELRLEAQSPSTKQEHDESRASDFEDLPLRLPPLLYSNRNASATSAGCHRLTRELGSSFGSNLQAIGAENGVSHTATFLTGLGVMISRILEIDAEFCVTVDASDKGLCPVRLHPSPTQSVQDALKDAEKALNRALRYWPVGQNRSHEPTIVLRHEIVDAPQEGPGATLSGKEANYAGVEISVRITECSLDGSIIVTFDVAKFLYTENDAQLLLDCFLHVMQVMQTTISCLVSQCPLYEKDEAWKHTEVGRGLKMNHAWPPTLLHKIDEIVASQPGAIAVEDDAGNAWTYSQLSNRVQSLSQALLNAGATAGQTVAVFCEPGIDSLCALLAITRLAAIYVPLDLNHPMERLSLIVDDSKPYAIIMHEPTHERIAGLQHSANILDMTNLPTTSEPVPITCTSSDGAFVLYTSGSTGCPKGVLLSYENFLGQIASFTREYGLKRERVLQQSSLGFDVSLHQTFVALTTGGTLIIATNMIRREPSQLAELMRTTAVTFTLGVPSEYAVLLRYGRCHLQQCPGWRYAVCGGERMTVSLKQAFRELGSAGPTLVSCYGPTEVSLASSYGVLSYTDRSAGSEDENSPVGSTLPNYAVYVLDKNMNAVPTGFPGEVYVSGVGVALGYLNNETRTKERFLPDPFDVEGKSRMYRTGDRGRLLPDGSLVFLGRMEGDFQVKLRGIRIELDEVANAIVSASNGVLRQAAVILRGTENKYLLAFVTFSEGWAGNKEDYLAGLLQRLPFAPSMRPAQLLPLDRLPTNVNGKLDRRALDTLVIRGAQPKSNQPLKQSGNDTENRLKEAWKAVLGENNSLGGFEIRSDSDFFQVGGNSLLLVKLQAAVAETFGATIPIRELFQISVLKTMSARLASTQTETEEIEWDEEVNMHLRHLNTPLPCISTNSRPAQHGSQVLLTGTTGFLGRYILRRLVDDPAVHTIHCLAVRQHSISSNGTLARISSPKIKLWPGDLSKPYLGLMGSTFTRLAQSIDLIIHNGADVSFLKTYSSLRAPNVQSSVELARMALLRGIPLHYVSSGGVMRLASPSSCSTPDSEASSHSGYFSGSEPSLEGPADKQLFYPPTNGSDGYIASKWASEQTLERGREFGLRCYIHRPTTLVGDGVPSTDLLHNVLRYSGLLKAVPRFNSLDGVIDMVPVDEVAGGILRCAREQVSGGITCHSGAQVPLSDLAGYVSETSVPLKTLEMEEWVHQATILGLDSQMASVLLSEEGRKGHGLIIPQA